MIARRLAVLSAAAVIASSSCDAQRPADAERAVEVLEGANDLARRHRLAEALEHIESRVGPLDESDLRHPPHAALRERQATLLLRLSRPGEAVPLLEALRRARPGESRIDLHLARALVELDRHEEAVPIFERLPGAERSSELVSYAMALIGSGRKRDGAAVLAGALARDPWLEEGYLHFGRALVALGEPAAAEPFLRHYRAGEEFRRQEQEALQLEFGSQEAEGTNARARALARRGRIFDAMLHHNLALRKKPGLGAAYLDLARLSIFIARPDQAEQVLRTLPRNEQVLEVLGEAHEATGNIEGALASYRAALEMDAGLESIGKRVEALEATGREPDPVAELRRSAAQRMRGKPLSQCVDELLDLARGLASLDRIDDARKLVLFVARLAPEHEEATRRILELFDRPEDVFVRLWALERPDTPEARTRFDSEARRLELDPDAVRDARAGKVVRSSE